MTKNERKMLLELAKGISRLSKVAEILATSINNGSIKKELDELIKANEDGIAQFIKLASEAWVSDEQR